MEASEIYAKGLNAKEVLTPMIGDFFHPIADGTVKLSGKNQVLRTSTLNWDRPDRGMMVKLGMISGPIQATLFIVITWNPE